MQVILGFIAVACFGLVAVIAEGKQQAPNTLKTPRNKRDLSRR